MFLNQRSTASPLDDDTLALAPVASPKFPGYREFCREFRQKRPSGMIFVPNFPLVFRALRAKFPTRPSREFFKANREFFEPIRERGVRHRTRSDAHQGRRREEVGSVP
jgi:hypothetical protein